MKITRLENGYRIDLSDAEFSLLGSFYGHALADAQDEESYAANYSAAEKRAWTMRERGGHFFRIDDDKRRSESGK